MGMENMSLTRLRKLGLPLSFLLPMLSQLDCRFAVLLCLHDQEAQCHFFLMLLLLLVLVVTCYAMSCHLEEVKGARHVGLVGRADETHAQSCVPCWSARQSCSPAPECAAS